MKTNQSESDKKRVKVSIIIPSFNKYPLNLITLYSLEFQTFDLTKVEVIVVDDASTDQTETIPTEHSFTYQLKYLKNSTNQGRAKSRNIGLNEAKGELVIFLDGEMLTDPSFIENHWKHHQGQSNLVVTGAMHYKAVYSYLFPEFNRRQMKEIQKLTKKINRLSQRLERYKQIDLNNPQELLTIKDIKEQTYHKLVIEKNFFADEIISHYGVDLKGFHFPWMAFLTGNVSLRKSLLDKVGFFDERFNGYGYEDWELGYRLHKAGAIFCAKDDVISYHQEHPISYNKWNEATKNYLLFTQLHPNIEILLLGLEIARITNLTTLNKILQEYQLLETKYPNKFSSFKSDFIKLLKTVAIFLKLDIRHRKLLNASGVELSATTLKDLNSLKKKGYFTNLVDVFEKMIAS